MVAFDEIRSPNGSLPLAVESALAGEWDATRACASATLDFDDRYRRRGALVLSSGERVLVDLPRARPLANGDGLRLDDGRWVMVFASHEPLTELRAASAADAVRLAWHLGNRHAAAQFSGAAIRIRRDPVLEDLARRLGASVEPIDAPFQPEAGAYDAHPLH